MLDINDVNFGTEVRKKLIDMNKKPVELANILGISSTYLYDILNGNRKGTKIKLKIVELLDA